MADDRPIGVFDSGLGGLTVLKQLLRLLPNENYVYLGDTARVPYGTRSKSIVEKFSLEDAHFLVKQNVKVIVVACNTASALAVKKLRGEIGLPLFDVVSAGVESVSKPKGGKICVIGTRGTVKSHAYKTLFKQKNKNFKIVEIACPLFVPVIEEGKTEGPLINLLAKEYLADVKKANVGTIILGCTHYPLIAPVIKAKLEGINVVDPGQEVAKIVKSYLERENLTSTRSKKGRVDYYLTDLTDSFVKTAEMFLSQKISGEVKQVSLQ